jgi:hypothetical protein
MASANQGGPASNRSTRACPNCKAVVPAGSVKCPGCQLEVAKMAGFLAAMRAAQKKGLAKTEIEKPRARQPEPGRYDGANDRPSIIPKLIMVALLLAVVAGAYVYFTRPKIPAWSTLPSTAEGAARALLQHIATGESTEYDKGYAMLAAEAHDKEDDDERGHYRGLFHAVHMYLTGEFGPGWETTMALSPDPKDANVIRAAIGPETLHVRVSQQTPADKLASAGEHYGIVGIDEFDVRDAASYQSAEARMGVVRGVAGQGAVDNIKSVLGASNFREGRVQKKLRLLPILRNPRETNWKTIIQAYPLHDDPVMRARLTQILGDERYDPTVREKAKNVLDDRVTDEDKIAAGVP